MSWTAIRSFLTAVALLGGTLAAPAARALDAIPIYDVVPISGYLAAHGSSIGISSAASVNEQDDAVGFAIIDGQYRAFAYSSALGAGAAGLAMLPELPGWSSHLAYDVTDRIGDALIIVGVAQSGIYDAPQVGVVWTLDLGSGAASALEVGPPPGHSSTSLTDINNLGLAVGSSVNLYARPMAYDVTTGTVTMLDLPGVPNDINDANTVIGNEWRADLALAPDGTVTAGPAETLPLTRDIWWTYNNAINASGAIAARTVMTYGDGSGYQMNGAARYSDAEGWKMLWVWSRYDGAAGLNDLGDVVGSLGAGGSVRPALFIDALNAAYFVADLVDPAATGGYVSSVADINNRGTIAAANATLLVRAGNLPVPAAPGGLTAEPHFPTWQQPWNAITLNWQDDSPYTRSFSVERRVAGSADWSVILEGWSNTAMWDMDVALDTTYDYRVRARGLAGYSAYSNIATATSPAEPVDTTAPVVAIVTPSDGAAVDGRVPVRVEASDNVGVNWMDVRVTGNYYDQQLCSGSGPVLDCSWNTRKVENGVYRIEAYASDAMGNGGSHSIEVTLGGDPGGGGESFELLVQDLAMSAKTRRGTTTVTGTVLVTDGNGAPVKSAIVTATWTLPGGTLKGATAYTDRGGKAKFEQTGGSGTYTLTVTNITRSGYSFDPACCTLAGSITVN